MLRNDNKRTGNDNGNRNGNCNCSGGLRLYCDWVGAGAPDVEEGGGDGEENRTEDDADGAEDGDASQDGEQDGCGVGAQVSADEDRIEDVVDGADDEATPDGEERGLTPVAVEAEVDGDGSPDEEGTEGWDHGEGHQREGPEDDTGNSEGPEGKAGEEALNSGDGESAEGGCEDGVADTFKELVGFVFAQGKKSVQRGDGEGAVAKEEEEQKEHDDELGDEADGVAEERAEFSSEEAAGGAGCVVDVDGVREGFEARG